MSKDELWLRAQNLLAFALQARERGDLDLAEELTARAVQLLEKSNGITDVSEPLAPPPSQLTVVPQQQQQQQQKTKKDDEKE